MNEDKQTINQTKREQIKKEVLAAVAPSGFKTVYLGEPRKVSASQFLSESRIDVLIDNLTKIVGDKCTCTSDERHGETMMWCCHNCGLRTESFSKQNPVNAQIVIQKTQATLNEILQIMKSGRATSEKIIEPCAELLNIIEGKIVFPKVKFGTIQAVCELCAYYESATCGNCFYTNKFEAKDGSKS